MSTQGLSIVASGDPQGAKHYNELFDDIEFRLEHHQSPAIVFNKQESSTYAHTVLVTGTGKLRMDVAIFASEIIIIILNQIKTAATK